jgi:nicotinamide riboside kinase
MPSAILIALLGAESTGKTALALALAEQLSAAGTDAVAVPEALRAFCDAHGRAPRADEQAELAREQDARIAAAARTHTVVIADTTALMTAVYSDVYFNDPSLYEQALRAQRAFDLTLLTATDLPWVADGFLRDGPSMRESVDARLRAALREADLPFSVVVGQDHARTRAALQAVWRCLRPPRDVPDAPRWRWVCQHCSDGACEAALLALAR